MQQNTSARTLRRAAVIAMIAGVLTVAAPVGVRALPGTSDDQPVLADTGASGYEPLILTVGVAMLAGGAVVIGAAKYRAHRVAGAEDEDEEWDEEFDDEDVEEEDGDAEEDGDVDGDVDDEGDKDGESGDDSPANSADRP